MKEDWLCNDFSLRGCLFEDAYGCVGDYNCINKDKDIDGYKCIIGGSENNSGKPIIEIDGEVYVYEKANDNMHYITRNDLIVCPRSNGETVKIINSSTVPEKGKIYIEGGKVMGFVADVKNVEKALTSSEGSFCSLLVESGSQCFRVCSTDKEYYYDYDKGRYVKQIECDYLLHTNGGLEEFYCKESVGSCKTKEEISSQNNKQYLNKSCCIENDKSYLMSNINNIYYKIDKDSNNDYVEISQGEYVKKSDVYVVRKVKGSKYKCLILNMYMIAS